MPASTFIPRAVVPRTTLSNGAQLKLEAPPAWTTAQLMSTRTQPVCAARAPSRYRARSVEPRFWMLPPAANPKRPFWVPAGAGGGEDGVGTATAAVAAEFATVAPLTFDAFTAMRSVIPASAGEITWTALVCAAIGAHAAPPASQRSH